MIIIGEPLSRVVWIDDQFVSPERSQRVWNHSPDGFNWGYEGSGPAQLALAILLAAGIPPDRAVSLHQHFKRTYIAPLPQGLPFVLDVDVVAWATARAGYTCPRCGAVSYNPHDIDQRYCGACHRFEDDDG
jgi:ribosomal protein S27AE